MIKSKVQTYNDGVIKISTLQNVSLPGKMPKMEMVEKVCLRFKERTVGINRYYSAAQNNIKVDRLIRCLKHEITTQDVAVIEGEEYRIKQVQFPEDVYPKSMDLSLERVAQSDD